MSPGYQFASATRPPFSTTNPLAIRLTTRTQQTISTLSRRKPPFTFSFVYNPGFTTITTILQQSCFTILFTNFWTFFDFFTMNATNENAWPCVLENDGTGPFHGLFTASHDSFTNLRIYDGGSFQHVAKQALILFFRNRDEPTKTRPTTRTMTPQPHTSVTSSLF